MHVLHASRPKSAAGLSTDAKGKAAEYFELEVQRPEQE